jgi:hypothetical protein
LEKDACTAYSDVNMESLSLGSGTPKAKDAQQPKPKRREEKMEIKFKSLNL